MTACPTCGHDPDRRFRNELEMQHPTRAAELSAAAAQCGEEPRDIGYGMIGWRGLVWDRITIRKPTTCARTGRPLPAGSAAYRQLSEVKGREQRVAADAWGLPLADDQTSPQAELF